MGTVAAAGVPAGFAQSDIDAFIAGEAATRTAVYSLRVAAGGWTVLGIRRQADSIRPAMRSSTARPRIVTHSDCAPTFGYTLTVNQPSLHLVENKCPGCGLVAGTIIFQAARFTKVADRAGDGRQHHHGSRQRGRLVLLLDDFRRALRPHGTGMAASVAERRRNRTSTIASLAARHHCLPRARSIRRIRRRRRPRVAKAFWPQLTVTAAPSSKQDAPNVDFHSLPTVRYPRPVIASPTAR